MLCKLYSPEADSGKVHYFRSFITPKEIRINKNALFVHISDEEIYLCV